MFRSLCIAITTPAIELQAITQNLVKVALGASVAYLTAYMAYATFRMSLLAVCPI